VHLVGCTVEYITMHGPMNINVFPEDGRKDRPKHEERFKE